MVQGKSSGEVAVQDNEQYESNIQESMQEAEGKHLLLEQNALSLLELKCQFCRYTADCKSSLRRHMRRKHFRNSHDKSETKFKCEDCGNSYAHKRGLLQHQRLKHGRLSFSRFECDYCNYMSIYKGHLRRHIRCKHLDVTDVSGAKYKCEKCGNAYFHKRTLRSHKMYECNQKPSFACNYCDHKASLKGNLFQHIKRRHLTPIVTLKVEETEPSFLQEN